MRIAMYHDDRLRGVTRRRGFSLIELMLAVSISTVIIAALYAVFNQTQRALRSNVNQVDVLESGRAAMDLITRQLALMAAMGRTNTPNLVLFRTPTIAPVIQPLPSAPGGLIAFARTNSLWQVYFAAREGARLDGTGFRVTDAANGVGTLGQLNISLAIRDLTGANLIPAMMLAAETNYSRVIDGVIHFRVQAFDSRGYPMVLQYQDGDEVNDRYPGVRLERDRGLRTETQTTFFYRALPAYVEVELGILEPQTLEQYRSFPLNSDFARKFLADHVGQVHLFRQRVPIRQGGIYPLPSSP